MLSQKFRFRGHSSLGFVYRRGTTIRGQSMALRYVRNERRDNFRVAVVVSRKVHKSAVVRNRIRRRIYEIIRRQVAATTESFDLVFTIYSDKVASMEAAELEASVLGLLRRAGATR